MSAADPIKTYDARWEIHEFDDQAIRRLCEATLLYGIEQHVDTITLARDARLSAGHVMELAVETALSAGFNVLLCPEPISTPQSYFLTLHASQLHPGTMGLTITASHNPRDYVGVKFTIPTVRAVGLDCGPKGGLTRVREIYHSDQTLRPEPSGRLELVNMTDAYINFAMKQAGVLPDALSGMKVVLDAFHGSAGPELYRALRVAGVEVDARRIIPDGNFPDGSPNPTSLGKMDLAIARAKEIGAVLALGLDGDGDRIVFADHRGTLSAGVAAIPILKAAGLDGTQKETPAVLYDPKISPAALAEWEKLRVRPLLFRNGHSQIKDCMRAKDAAAAAEESGHYYHRMTLGDLTVACENSVLTILLMLKALKMNPKLMDELWDLENAIHRTGEFNYQFPNDAIRDRAMAAVVARLSGDGATTLTATPEGVDLEGTVVNKGVSVGEDRVDLDPGWYNGFLRASTTERSVARSYFCAGEREPLERIEKLTRDLLKGEFNGEIVD